MLTLAVSPLRGVLASSDMAGMMGNADSIPVHHEMPASGHMDGSHDPVSGSSEHNCNQCCDDNCCDQSCSSSCAHYTSVIPGSISTAIALYNGGPFISIAGNYLEQFLFPLLQPPISRLG